MKRIVTIIFIIVMLYAAYSAYEFKKLSVDIQTSTNRITQTYNELVSNMEKTTDVTYFNTVNGELSKIVSMQDELKALSPKINMVNFLKYKKEILNKYSDMESRLSNLNENVKKTNGIQ